MQIGSAHAARHDAEQDFASAGRARGDVGKPQRLPRVVEQHGAHDILQISQHHFQRPAIAQVPRYNYA